MKLSDMFRTCVPSRLILILGTFIAGVIAFANKDFTTMLIAIVALALIDSASSSINSVYDLDIDAINRPNRPLVKLKINKNQLALFVLVLILLSLTFSLLISVLFSLVILFRLALELFYSVLRLKKTPILNHIIVGLMYCIVPLLGATIISNAEFLNIFYFFFVLSVIMTPLKDISDYKGDKKLGVKTLPVLIGVKKARDSILVIVALMLTTIMIYSYFIGSNLLYASLISLILFVFFVFLGLKFDRKNKESVLTKLSMLVAIIIEIIFAIFVGVL